MSGACGNRSRGGLCCVLSDDCKLKISRAVEQVGICLRFVTNPVKEVVQNQYGVAVTAPGLAQK